MHLRHRCRVVVPEQVIKRLDGAPKGKRRDEGLRICVEQIGQRKEMPGISGIDIMDLDPPATSKWSEPPTHRTPLAARGKSDTFRIPRPSR